MDMLVGIKRLVLSGNVVFTQKAVGEMMRDGLDEDLVCESIMNAPGIRKTIRSHHPQTGRREYLYVIVGLTYDDVPVYTKGKILRTGGEERFYVLISSKRAVA